MDDGDPEETRAVVELGVAVDSAAAARAAVRQHLAGVPDDVVDTACLLADELVANVLLHVGTPSQVVVVRGPTEVRIEVSDLSPQRPVPRSARPQDLTGRGLQILDELATDWGSTSHGPGKTVWFTLALP